MTVCRISLLAGVFCLLQACSTVPEKTLTNTPEQDWALYQLQAGRVNSWNLRGRAAIFVDDDVHNIGLRWRKNLDEFVIVLEAPFGQGVIRLESSRQTGYPVKLSLGDGQIIYAEDAESALLDAIGFAIPVTGLVSWIRGIPGKATPFEHVPGPDGRLRSLSQDEWTINYLDYFERQEVERGLPKKMYLKHDRLALKIVIEHWQKPLEEVSNGELFPSFD